MFKRKLEEELFKWMKLPNRKPIILRGARQVGKSTLIKKFSSEFKYYVNLNLERNEDKKYFESNVNVKSIWDRILFEKNIPNDPSNTLLFIDEIQEMPLVIKLLRYFYEDLPELYVISAGSLLEFALKDIESYPVGRVIEFILHPLNFEEFLEAINEIEALQQLQKVPFDEFAFNKLNELFRVYVIIGGMPEVVKSYIDNNMSMVNLKSIYSSIWDAYKSDIIKYAKNSSEAKILRHIIDVAPYVKDRITFANFGNSNYRSREVGEAFRALELSKIIYLIYPTTDFIPPQIPNIKRKPRIQFLDTGLLNYASDIQSELLQLEEFNSYYKGYLIAHIFIQELIASQSSKSAKPMFWVKENTNTNAEVDLVCKYKNYLFPIEFKSGSKGSLKSLNEFIDLANHNIAFRLLNNRISIEKSRTKNGKEFNLISLPQFVISQIDKYIEWSLSKLILK